MLLSVLPLILAAPLLCTAEPAAAGSLADHAALIQVGAVAPSQPGSSAARPSKRLIVLLDGTAVQYSGILWKFSQGLVNDGTQMVHYEIGVKAYEGHGVRVRGLSAYSFLTKNYLPGDEVFIYGLSRGCMSGRYLQGIIHAYGILKEAFSAQAVEPDIAENMLSSTETWRDVDIKVLGCVDGVMNTILSKTGDEIQDLGYLRQQIHPEVRNFLHALALEEVSTMILAAEVLLDPRTHQEQVWFQSEHIELCENFDIPAGWLAERSQELGNVTLKDGFLRSLNYDFTTFEPKGVKHSATVRNPLRCRKELYGGRRIKVHSSVKDRMELVKGWLPATSCCYPEAFSDENVEWVTTPVYEQRKTKSARAQWLRAKIDYTNISGEELARQDMHWMMMTQSGTFRVAGLREFKRIASDKPGYTRSAVVPYPWHSQEYTLSLVHGPCDSLMDCGWESLFFEGRYYKTLYQLRLDHRGPFADLAVLGGKFNVSLDFLYDDEAAGQALDTTTPRCAHLKNLLLPPADLCNNTDEEYPSTCEKLRSMATTGSSHLRSASAPSAAMGFLAAALVSLPAVAAAVGTR